MSKILILTLTEQRDKPVDERLAQCLRDMGHEVMVRNFVLAGSDAVTVEKPDAVVLPMIGSDHKLNFARQIKEWGVVTIVRRGEAGAGRPRAAALVLQDSHGGVRGLGICRTGVRLLDVREVPG